MVMRSLFKWYWESLFQINDIRRVFIVQYYWEILFQSSDVGKICFCPETLREFVSVQ